VGHGRAGALLAVAQGGVEDNDAILVGWCGRSHELDSFIGYAPPGA